jgi:hypothetical protein
MGFAALYPSYATGTRALHKPWPGATRSQIREFHGVDEKSSREF